MMCVSLMHCEHVINVRDHQTLSFRGHQTLSVLPENLGLKALDLSMCLSMCVSVRANVYVHGCMGVFCLFMYTCAYVCAM